jgi:mRNA interferase YafQ
VREIEWTTVFARDFKKAQANSRHRDVALLLEDIGNHIAQDVPLPARYRDHALSGEYIKHRECHLKPDLLLIYRKPDDQILRFVRLGSHSELF